MRLKLAKSVRYLKRSVSRLAPLARYFFARIAGQFIFCGDKSMRGLVGVAVMFAVVVGAIWVINHFKIGGGAASLGAGGTAA